MIILSSDGLVETRRRNLIVGMDELREAAVRVVGDGGSPASRLAALLVTADHEDGVTTLVIDRAAGRRR